MKGDAVYTTGQIARLCAVAPRTVAKWFDSGKLRGYRIPGSQDRRVPRAELERFLRDNGMPLLGADDRPRLLLMSPNTIGEPLAALLPSWRVEAVPTLFGLGMALGQNGAPDLLLLDLHAGRIDCLMCAEQVRELYPTCPLFILAGEDEPDLAGLRSCDLHTWQHPVDLAALALVLDTRTQGVSRAVPRSRRHNPNPPGSRRRHESPDGPEP
jgi:two-component system, OmpR family, response regulator RpaA